MPLTNEWSHTLNIENERGHSQCYYRGARYVRRRVLQHVFHLANVRLREHLEAAPNARVVFTFDVGGGYSTRVIPMDGKGEG